MSQEKSSSNWLIKLLSAAAFVGLVSLIALILQAISFGSGENSAKTQQANQAIQIAKAETQNALLVEQNLLQAEQLTLQARQVTIEGQIPLPTDNPNFALTATAYIVQATQIEATSQAIATRQKGIEATQTTVAQLQVPFTVHANQLWTNTGINIEAGDLITIKYITGEWTNWSGKVQPFDGNGDPSYVCAKIMTATDCVQPLPDIASGALIARIGETKPIFIGSQSSFTAINSGLLELGMNDSTLASDYRDNEGSLTVGISVTKSK